MIDGLTIAHCSDALTYGVQSMAQALSQKALKGSYSFLYLDVDMVGPLQILGGGTPRYFPALSNLSEIEYEKISRMSLPNVLLFVK